MTKYNKFNVDNRNDLSPDNIYVDIVVRNLTDGNRTINAEYNVRKSEPIIDNPSDYYLTLARWSLPAFNIPLFVIPIQNNQSDVNLSEYSITLETSTDTVQVYIDYISRNSATAPTTAIPEQETSNSYYWIYDYQHMVDLVNNAISSAFSTITGLPVGAVVPRILFNPITNLFSLIAEEIDYTTTYTPANPAQDRYDANIKIWFNYKLFELFSGMSSFLPLSPIQADGRDAQLLVYYIDNYYVEPNATALASDVYLQMLQQIKTISTWSAMKSVVFETALIPIGKEYTSISGNSYKKVLTDFEPLKSSEQDVRTLLQYYPQGQYRLVDCIGTNPLYNIDIKAEWIDTYGNIHRLTIPYLHQMSAKLLFVKRNLYKTNNKDYI